MKNLDSYDYQQVMNRLIDLPNKISRNYDLQYLPQLVLHYIGHKDCFDLKKAAYFADNPDFDHFLGAAGYDQNECCYDNLDNLWSEPSKYLTHSEDGNFHNKIQKILRTSFKKQGASLSNSEDLSLLAKELGMESPNIVSWDLKHGNHGVLMYETNKTLDQQNADLLEKALSFLNFCPLR